MGQKCCTINGLAHGITRGPSPLFSKKRLNFNPAFSFRGQSVVIYHSLKKKFDLSEQSNVHTFLAKKVGKKKKRTRAHTYSQGRIQEGG